MHINNPLILGIIRDQSRTDGRVDQHNTRITSLESRTSSLEHNQRRILKVSTAITALVGALATTINFSDVARAIAGLLKAL